MLVVTPILAIFSYPLLEWFDINVVEVRTLPKFQRAILDFGVFVVAEEIGFFYSHWLLHHRKVSDWTRILT